MVSHIKSIAFSGLNTLAIDVQVHVHPGIYYFAIVGLPNKTVGESKDRIRSAFSALGLSLPHCRIVVNLSPADLAKEGSHFDLAIAIGLMIEMNLLPRERLHSYLIMGELALDSSVSPVNGILPAALHALTHQLGLICPEANGSEAIWAGKNDILATPSLLSLLNHFKDIAELPPPSLTSQPAPAPAYTNLADMKGQETAKRALEIAACGNHNILITGPPGAGKSMLAASLPGILPPMTSEEILENSMIASINGTLRKGKLHTQRPFREPHHSCSLAAMTGGGRFAQPGEITLAHNGVLFLDELPEFPRNVLEALRQPLENHQITIARAHAHVTYPARFLFIAAMNPCRCGYLGDEARMCSKAPGCAQTYQAKISGPLLDRIDMHISMDALTPTELQSRTTGEDSQTIAQRVIATRTLQQNRYHDTPITTNAQLSGTLLEKFTSMETKTTQLLENAFEKMKLSMRSYKRIIKLARTIADMEQCPVIARHHMAEAISYRYIK